MANTKQVVLPADVYDTLEFVAEAYGGIGGGSSYEYKYPSLEDCGTPLCLHGFIRFVDEYETMTVGSVNHAVCDALADAGFGDRFLRFGDHLVPSAGTKQINYGVFNDAIVEAVNADLGNPGSMARVPFDLYCKKGNIVRGDA